MAGTQTAANVSCGEGRVPEADAARLTGLSARQLRYWARTGFFRPLTDAGQQPPSRTPPSRATRCYSPADLLDLRVLARLRREAGCSLQHLRQVKARLAADGGRWADAPLTVLNGKVLRYDPRTGRGEDVVSGQAVWDVPGIGTDGAAARGRAIRSGRRRPPRPR